MTEFTRRPPPPPPRVSLMNWEQAKWLLEKYLYQIQVRYEALPTPHAETHMGGDDDITGTSAPSAIVPGDEGSVGDGGAGFAPIGHVHDATGLGNAAALDLDVEPFNDDDLTLVHAPQLFRLLQEILFKLEELERRLM